MTDPATPTEAFTVLWKAVTGNTLVRVNTAIAALPLIRAPYLPMNTDRYATLVFEYAAGATIYELAEKYERRPQTIHAALKTRGCVFRARGRRVRS